MIVIHEARPEGQGRYAASDGYGVARYYATYGGEILFGTFCLDADESLARARKEVRRREGLLDLDEWEPHTPSADDRCVCGGNPATYCSACLHDAAGFGEGL